METCYHCGKPAPYICDAAGCGHQMCMEHSTLVMLGDAAQDGGGEASATHAAHPDHAHYCLDHAPTAHM